VGPKNVQCPSCARLQEPRLICLACKAPLACDLDCFAALGLSRKLEIDLEKLEAVYHELGRALHPDRFASAAPEIRDASLHATALLTRSYRTLRDPATRASYWLELHGHKLAENNQRVPPALAAFVFEVQEELAALNDSSNGEASSVRTTVEARQREIDTLIRHSSAELEQIFHELDATAAPSPELIARLKSILAEGAYLNTLMRDLRRTP
jgi:molecular chaperone HscB